MKDSKFVFEQILLPILKDELVSTFNDVHTLLTFIVSPNENGFENCIDNPLSTFPRTSLAAKAVATPTQKHSETEVRS